MGLESSTKQKCLNSACDQGTVDRSIPTDPWTILMEGRQEGMVGLDELESVVPQAWELVVECVGLVVVVGSMLAEVGYIVAQIIVFGKSLEYHRTSSSLLHLLRVV